MSDLEIAKAFYEENKELKEEINKLKSKNEKLEIILLKLKRYLWDEQEDVIYLDNGEKATINHSKKILIDDVLKYIDNLEG